MIQIRVRIRKHILPHCKKVHSLTMISKLRRAHCRANRKAHIALRPGRGTLSASLHSNEAALERARTFF
jgi:hypothetical protein